MYMLLGGGPDGFKCFDIRPVAGVSYCACMLPVSAFADFVLSFASPLSHIPRKEFPHIAGAAGRPELENSVSIILWWCANCSLYINTLSR